MTEKRIKEFLKRLDNAEKRLAELETAHASELAHKNHINEQVEKWMKKMRLRGARFYE